MSTPQKSTKITSDIFGEEIIKKIKECIKNHFRKDLPQSSEAAQNYKTNLKTAIENVFENNGFTNISQSTQILAFLSDGSFQVQVKEQLQRISEQDNDPAVNYVKVEKEDNDNEWEVVTLPTE